MFDLGIALLASRKAVLECRALPETQLTLRMHIRLAHLWLSDGTESVIDPISIDATRVTTQYLLGSIDALLLRDIDELGKGIRLMQTSFLCLVQDIPSSLWSCNCSSLVCILPSLPCAACPDRSPSQSWTVC